jgi:hypothetical protein
LHLSRYLVRISDLNNWKTCYICMVESPAGITRGVVEAGMVGFDQGFSLWVWVFELAAVRA